MKNPKYLNIESTLGKDHQTTRIEWLDVSKGIGIVLVLCAHAMDKNTQMWNMITLFHMPLFFIISGYLFNLGESFKQTILSKIFSLYIPYVTISIMAYGYMCFFENMNFEISVILRILLLIYTPGITGASWFISVLFCSEIGFWLLLYFLEKKTMSIYLAIMIAVLIGLIGFLTNLPFGMSRVLVSILFLMCGYSFRKCVDERSRKKSSVVAYVVIMIVSIAIVYAFSFENYSSYSSNNYTNIFVSVICAVSGTIFIFCISRLIEYLPSLKKIFGFLGKNTMGIIFFQFFAFRIVNLAIVCIYGIDHTHIFDFPVNYMYNTWFWQLCYVLTGIVVSILLYKPFEHLFRQVKRIIICLSKN